MTDGGPPVVVERAGPVARVVLNRPDHHNAVSMGMNDQLYERLVELAEDDDVHVVVLTGAGRSFCPGADLTGDVGDAGGVFRRRSYQAAVVLHEMPQVTVAAINGACAGAGLTWAAACDFRFCSERAKFRSAFLDVEVAGDMGGFWSIPRIVGPARARELHFLMGKFDSAEAVRLGFVTAAFADDCFADEVDAVVAGLAARNPRALRLSKANFVAAERMGFADFVALETERHLALFTDADATATAEALKRRGREVSGNT